MTSTDLCWVAVVYLLGIVVWVVASVGAIRHDIGLGAAASSHPGRMLAIVVVVSVLWPITFPLATIVGVARAALLLSRKDDA